MRNIPQCVASMGTILGDKYIVVASTKPKILIWSEGSRTGPQLTCFFGPATCLAAQVDTGEIFECAVFFYVVV